MNEARQERRRDPPEGDARARIPVWLLELRVIPRVEHFDPQPEPGRLADDSERLLQADVPVIKARAAQHRCPVAAL